MEPEEVWIASFRSKTGVDEAEARILYHLEAADWAMNELTRDLGTTTPLTSWHIHIDALKDSVWARIPKGRGVIEY
jgi:hypothetical protein